MRSILAVALLAVLQVLFWKWRVLDPGTDPQVQWLFLGDLYMEHHPMVSYAARMLAHGELPLWNPYQLGGMPFLAVPHPGTLYPPHVLYLGLETALATELSVVLHLVFAAVCTYGFARSQSADRIGAFAAALTFVWSGRVVTVAVMWPSWIETMSWMPATVWLVDCAIRGRRFAVTGLALAVCAQILAGSSEAMLYNLYAAGLFALVRLLTLAPAEPARALRCGALLLAAVALGVALSAPQLLPSLELAEHSARVREGLTLRAATVWGTLAPDRLLHLFLVSHGQVRVGLVSLLALGLGLGFRGFGPLFAYAVILSGLAALMIFGGAAYQTYHETPIGELFRRPIKFSGLFVWGQALLVAIAVTRLSRWVRLPRRELWRQWSWRAAWIAGVLGLGWLVVYGAPTPLLPVVLGCALVFGLSSPPWLRQAALLALVGVQAGQLFLATRETYARPIRQPGAFERFAPLLDYLRERAGTSRIYISPQYALEPGLIQKQAMLRGYYTIGDYQALLSRRQQRYFSRLDPVTEAGNAYAGHLPLGFGTRWPQLDLTSTRIYLVWGGESGAQALGIASRNEHTGVRQLALDPSLTRGANIKAYERTTALPRAYFAATARVAGDAEQALAATDAPEVVAGREVVLETDGSGPPPQADPEAQGRVEILAYAPERVEIEVEASGPGFVVLTDSYYPDWRAFANDAELPLYRANYLFRAVPVPEGKTRLRFEYRPRAFRRGLLLGAGALVLLVGGECFAGVRRRRAAPG